MPKILIDIPEDTKGRLSFGITYKSDVETLCKALSKGIVLDNLTNGEVIQKVCPDAKFYCTERLQTAGFPRRDADFDLDWWNRKWKGEVK